MKFVIGLVGFALVAVAQCSVVSYVPGATTLVRTPQHDSAVIHSERVDGNFAYSTSEQHAYRAITPLQAVVHQPIVRTIVAAPAPAPVVRYSVAAPQVVHQVANPWVYAAQPSLVHYAGLPGNVQYVSGFPQIIPVEEAQPETATETETTEAAEPAAEKAESDDDSVSVESA